MNGVYMYQCIHVHMYFCYGDKEFIMQSTLFLGGLGGMLLQEGFKFRLPEVAFAWGPS